MWISHKQNTLNRNLHAPSTNQLCQFERQWSLFDWEPNKFSKKNTHWKKHTWKSIPNAEQRVTFKWNVFDEVVLSASWNSIVLLFILFISRWPFVRSFVFSHSNERKNLCVDSYCCRAQRDIHRTDYQIMCVGILLLLLYTLLSFKCSKSDLICTICMWIEHTPGQLRQSQAHCARPQHPQHSYTYMWMRMNMLQY